MADDKGIQTIRVPFLGNPGNRDTVTSHDQRFINAYFDIQQGAEGSRSYYMVKRPGYALYSSPSAAAAGRGMASWKGDLYSVFGTQIYKNTTNLGVTLTTSTGRCGIAWTRPAAATQYLAINDGVKLYLIAAGTGTVTTVTSMPANTGSLTCFDGYLFVIDTNNTIWQSDFDTFTSWNATKFITGQMYPGSGVAVCSQHNYIMALSDRSIQMFYDNANSSGSVLTNADQAMSKVGCSSTLSVCSDEDTIVWVSNSGMGGYEIRKMDGIVGSQPISVPGVDRILRGEGTNISSCNGRLFRIGGHKFYFLNLVGQSRTLIYDFTAELWLEWQDVDGASKMPFADFTQHNNALVGQHLTNGNIYTFSESTYQDAGTNFTVLGRFKRLDLEDNRRKFYRRAEIIGDKQTTTTNVSLQYSDDDWQTLSTARTMDMSLTRTLATTLGNSRRRAWQISYAGANPFRAEALELKFRFGME